MYSNLIVKSLSTVHPLSEIDPSQQKHDKFNQRRTPALFVELCQVLKYVWILLVSLQVVPGDQIFHSLLNCLDIRLQIQIRVTIMKQHKRNKETIHGAPTKRSYLSFKLVSGGYAPIPIQKRVLFRIFQQRVTMHNIGRSIRPDQKFNFLVQILNYPVISKVPQLVFLTNMCS